VLLTERPVHVELDARGRLHSESRAAIEYPDGFGLYRWHGVAVPEHVIRAPETITVAEIDAQTNAEVRRVMIERVGLARYMRDGGARLVHEDRDRFGHPRRLWKRELSGDEPIVIVEYTNSTPEPDGSHKIYTSRVHPQLRPLLGVNAAGEPRYGDPQKETALNAIASTWGLRGDEYTLPVET